MRRTATLGYGNKSDFTKFAMSNPGPAKYEWEKYRRVYTLGDPKYHGKSMGLGR